MSAPRSLDVGLRGRTPQRHAPPWYNYHYSGGGDSERGGPFIFNPNGRVAKSAAVQRLRKRAKSGIPPPTRIVIRGY